MSKNLPPEGAKKGWADSMGRPSEHVLLHFVDRRERHYFEIAQYLHAIGEWRVPGFTNIHQAIEWWEMPKAGTGFKVSE